LLSQQLSLWLCSKVEESFNTQAIHDLLYLRTNLHEYDHVSFPGVVPRTFLGAIVVALPYLWLTPETLLQLGKPTMQMVTRMTLGLFVWSGLVQVKKAVAERWGQLAGMGFALVTAVQFHIPFYATRTLPNTFALVIVLHALAQWMKGKPLTCVALLTAATTIFRCDMLVLLGPISLTMVLSGEVPLLRGIAVGAASGICALAATVFIDSVFWGRWLWPEGAVLTFNTVDNRSSEWGTFPWHWYVSSALPRALTATALLAACAVWSAPQQAKDGKWARQQRIDWAVVYYLGPFAAFVLLYSFLPHKELRFIFPAVCACNVAAGIGFAKLVSSTKERAFPRRLGVAMAAVALLATLALTCLVFTPASAYNYPGGYAFRRFHELATASAKAADPISVHIDVPSAMTGVSRFGEVQPGRIRYSKAEDLTDWSHFDWLLTADPSKHPQFEIRDRVAAFKRFSRSGLQLEDVIFIMQNTRR
jgi:alpha-1,6-mannosyltransferase